MLPAGIITFLFTDIQGSTPLWEKDPDGMGEALELHNAILHEAIKEHQGQVFKIVGDEFQAAFVDPSQAVQAAVAAQKGLLAASWSRVGPLRVRMGIHTGYAVTEGDDYAVAHTLNRAARIMSTADGGQILLSVDAVDQLGDGLPEGVSLRDLGRQRMKGMSLREQLFQLVIPGLPADLAAQNVAVEAAQKLEPSRSALRDALPDWDEEEVIPLFVGRKKELARLADPAADQVQFIIGGPGRGKTALVTAFARQAMAADPNLLVLSGQCREMVGLGEPLLPFRQILSQLTGDVTDAAILSREQARRLWEAMPETMPILAAKGLDLVGSLLPGRGIHARAASLEQSQTAWFRQFDEKVNNPQRSYLQQERLFGQVAATLQEAAGKRPLLVILEDLHWTDTASASLLFHLSEEIAGSRILLLATYRPEEVTATKGADRHPLAKMANEFKRRFGNVWLDLGHETAAEGRDFVNACLDVDGNDLDEKFRQQLFEHTGGHALFTVELLRAMRARGDLFLDEDGRWQARERIDWDTLPGRVEGVIEQRLGRLEDDLLAVLSVASVEGEVFTAQVVAQIQQEDERDLVRRLSRELEGQHRLVQAEGLAQVDGRRLARYRFRHQLFQRHLYQGLGEAEKAYLHEDVGLTLETLYGEQWQPIAATLAWHFDRAGLGEKALPYLLYAGDEARQLNAFEDAARHYEKALAIYKASGDYAAAARVLMKLGLVYHSVFDYEKARQAYNEGFSLGQQTPVLLRADQTAAAPHPLRYMGTVLPPTLDPTKTDEGELISDLFSGLVRLSEDADLVPDVAASWQIADGGLTYIFHLRDDVQWSDGQPVTAGDFVYAWRRALDPEDGAPAATILYDIKGARQAEDSWDPENVGVSAPDAFTLRVELEQPASYFLQVLAHGVAAPVPRHVVESYGETWADSDQVVTNGPFRLESFQQGEALTLRRNPTYHGPFQGNLEFVELQHHPDFEKAMRLYADDEIDILSTWSFSADEFQWITQQYADDYFNLITNLTGFLGFNVNRPPFDDARVRRAFVLATDLHFLADHHELGRAFPATGGFVPPGMPGHVPDIALPYDLAAARRLLAEAGYPDGRGLPPLTALLHPGDRVRLPEFTFKPWESTLGVKVSWQIVPWREYRERIRVEQPHLYGFGWDSTYRDPDGYLRTGMLHISEWRDPAYFELVERARGLLDHQERMRLYRQAEEILRDQAPIMPALYLRSNMLIKPWVRNYPLRDISYWHWFDVIIIDPH